MGTDRPVHGRAAARPVDAAWVAKMMVFSGLSLLCLMASGASVAFGDTALRLASVQIEGQVHGGPRAYHAMCARDPRLCMHDRQAGRIPGRGPAAEMNADRWRVLHTINAEVNARLRPVADTTLYGVSDYWTLGANGGDCEDYMIAKKQALIAAGWAADQLLYAVVEGTETPYHAVLVVRTDKGDFVLDNMRPRILAWEKTGYRFVVRQSAEDPHRWVRVVQTPRLSASAGLIATR